MAKSIVWVSIRKTLTSQEAFKILVHGAFGVRGSQTKSAQPATQLLSGFFRWAQARQVLNVRVARLLQASE